MKTNNFQQVKLEKKTDAGKLIDTIFIPQSYAVKGNYIERKIDGQWNNGWQVAEVYKGVRSEEQVLQARDLYKTHRKGTDI